MKLDTYLKAKVLILDGGMGTEIIKRVDRTPEVFEILNLEKKEIILDVHRAYIDAGADIITTNTLGANRLKLREFKMESQVKELNIAAVHVAKKAVEGKEILIAGSIGPTGKLIKPLGDVDENEVYTTFEEQAKALEIGGANFLLIETQIDIQEAKIAIRAAKENTSLPVALSLSYSLEEGRTVTGSDPETASVVFSSTENEILGINCGRHPEEFEEFISKTFLHSSKPLIVYANAGIPEKRGDELFYPLGPEEYAAYAEIFYKLGANIIGGCCGTSPEHIAFISKMLRGKKPVKRKEREKFFRAASRNSILTIGGHSPFRVIGENINPFGKKKLSQEIEAEKLEQIKKYARIQEQAQADAIDVNLGKKGDKSPEFYAKVVKELQNITRLPLYLDNNNPKSLELALFSYAGKAIINSVNGAKKNYETLFPLAKKHGSSVVLLAMDENGIPDTAKGKMQIVEKLIQKAVEFGLSTDDIIADLIILTISASPKTSSETLKAIEMAKSLGIPTMLGLSNLSFGLPYRQLLHSAFLPMAISRGLDSAIMNPLDKNLMEITKACDAITGKDAGMHFYIEKFSKKPQIEAEEKEEIQNKDPEKALFLAILEGEKTKAKQYTLRLVEKGMNGFKILESILSPALAKVGELYEKKIYFLPQLILSAEAMEEASDAIEKALQIDTSASKKLKIIMATVEGDLHDIGKNIVSLVLRNSGFHVLDLGKNTKAKTIVETAIHEKADFIGLSALMTTTMEEMKKVLDIKRTKAPNIKVIVGGAAVTPSFSREIGADAYGKDAMDAIRKIEKLSGNENEF